MSALGLLYAIRTGLGTNPLSRDRHGICEVKAMKAAKESTYLQIIRMYDVSDLDNPSRAMKLAEELIARGETDTWASVWWAYGAIHYDLGDEALEAALGKLATVSEPVGARAAALLLTAEIESTIAIQFGGRPEAERQLSFLAQRRNMFGQFLIRSIKRARHCPVFVVARSSETTAQPVCRAAPTASRLITESGTCIRRWTVEIVGRKGW
ncbi:MAG: hypothetical protein QM648_04940 [Solirubrobacterales bacterium]